MKRDDQDILIEQYKMYVDSAQKISERRSALNSTFTALMSGLLAATPVILKEVNEDALRCAILMGIGVLGILINVVWYLAILSCRQLNKVKFIVIGEIEKSLPFKCYEREWELIKDEENKLHYIRITAIERLIPLAFFVPFFVLVIYAFGRYL